MNEEWMYYLMELCNSREGYNFDSWAEGGMKFYDGKSKFRNYCKTFP
jgi:hypothetical protein